MRYEAGQKYGRLTLLRRDPKNRRRWICRCDCGVERSFADTNVRSGASASCGCKRRELLRQPRCHSYNPGARRVINSYRFNAKSAERQWSLTDQEALELFGRDCEYCGTPPSQVRRTAGWEFTYNGIDRIDSSRGYESGNVVPCCKVCNRAKLDMPLHEFLVWVQRIAQRNRLFERTAA